MVALIEGEAGIGKTTLAERLLDGCESGRVLRASGAELESLVSFGVVDQLLRLAGGSRSGVLTHEPATTAIDEVAVGLDLLRLTMDGGDRRTTIVIDDMQWTDEASAAALSFALRRLAGTAAFVVLIARDGEGRPIPDALRRLARVTVDLGPLTVDELRALVASSGVTMSELGLRRLQEHTRGSPLHASALLHEVPQDAWDDVRRALPAPRRVAAATTRRIASLSPEARELIRAASVLGPGASLTSVTSLAELRAPLDALDQAVAAGLVRAVDRPTAVEFTHPLVRAAVVDTLKLGDRTRLNLAAAELADDAGGALRHRVAASTEVDAELAAELEAHARGEWPAAWDLLLDASRLSPDATERERRLLAAVDAMLFADGAIAADAFRDEVLSQPPGPHRDSVLAHMTTIEGDPIETRSLLVRAWGDATSETMRSARRSHSALPCSLWSSCAETRRSNGPAGSTAKSTVFSPPRRSRSDSCSSVGPMKPRKRSRPCRRRLLHQPCRSVPSAAGYGS